MSKIKVIQEIFLKNGIAGYVEGDKFSSYPSGDNAVDICRSIDNMGADGIFITEISENDSEHDKNIDTVKEIVTAIDVPVILGGNVKRLEDVQKYLYAGADMAVLDYGKSSNKEMYKEASDRFGIEKIATNEENFR